MNVPKGVFQETRIKNNWSVKLEDARVLLHPVIVFVFLLLMSSKNHFKSRECFSKDAFFPKQFPESLKFCSLQQKYFYNIFYLSKKKDAKIGRLTE